VKFKMALSSLSNYLSLSF